MKSYLSARRWHLWIEYAFVVAIVAGISYVAWFYHENGYLPQPFFYEPGGVFMDWFSLSPYGYFRGAYDVNGSIYPPLSFVIMRIFSLPRCYHINSAEWARDCDWGGVAGLTGFIATNAVLTFVAFYKQDRATFLPRAFAMSFGLPMIYTYERGNILLLAYTFILLAFGPPLIRSARMRWFFGGLALNLKVYLIGAVLAPLLQRRWIQTEGIILWAAGIYLATYAFLGEGSPAEIFGNVTYYASGYAASNPLDLWYASSMVPVITLLSGENFPISSYMSSDTVNIILMVATTVARTTQILIVLSAAAIWIRPEVVPRHRGVFLAIAMAVTTSEVGGYTQILLLMFIFMERWQGIAKPLAIVMAYALCIPAEYVMGTEVYLTRFSWLHGSDVYAHYGLGLMALLRPLIAMLIVWCIASTTIYDVWVDIRHQGWKKRWRFRNDLPIMVGAGEAKPLSGSTER